MLVVYIGSLLLLVAAAFFTIDPVSNKPTTELTTANLREAFTTADFVQVVLKSVGVAAAVTALCIVVALPMAFYIAKVAKPRYRRALVVATLMPAVGRLPRQGLRLEGGAPAGVGVRRRQRRRLPRLGVRVHAGLRLGRP